MTRSLLILLFSLVMLLGFKRKEPGWNQKCYSIKVTITAMGATLRSNEICVSLDMTVILKDSVLILRNLYNKKTKYFKIEGLRESVSDGDVTGYRYIAMELKKQPELCLIDIIKDTGKITQITFNYEDSKLAFDIYKHDIL